MTERRESVRMNLNTVVEYEKIDSNEPPGQFESKDISVGGMCLIVDERIKTGDKFILKIKLPTSKTIHTKGKVIRIKDRQEKKYEASIEFFDLSDQDIEEIKKYIFLGYLYE